MTSESEDVLKALSSSTRRTIMRQISQKGSATYTEIMHVLNLDPSLMSGTFNYHLKELTEVGLVKRVDNEYSITELGKRALILVDQVAKDVRIDNYGVLSAVMSMSPTKELEFFLYQMGSMVSFIAFVLSLIPTILNYGSHSLASWFSIGASLIFLSLAIFTCLKMIQIIRRYRLGFSSFIFLSSNWFFIRSPNRNNFFFIIMALVGTTLTSALSFLLPYTGEISLFSPFWYGSVFTAIILALLTIALLRRARKKAIMLEARYNE